MALVRLLNEKGLGSKLGQGGWSGYVLDLNQQRNHETTRAGLSVLSEMEAMGVEGDAPLYTALVGAFGRGGMFEDVIKVSQYGHCSLLGVESVW
jgi:hypothetical protein